MKTILPAIAERYSCRSYTDQPVDQETLDSILEAARRAPSACNKQPWRYYVVRSLEMLREVRAHCFAPPVANRFVNDAPVLVGVGIKKDVLVHGVVPFIKGIPYQYIDVGISTDHLMLQATALGLATCWIGWFDVKAARRVLSIPSSVEPCGFISLGYPADEKSTEIKRLPKEKIATFC